MSKFHKSPKTSSMPVAMWPEQDLRLWNAALAPADPLAPGNGGGADRWATSTQKVTANGYGCWLAWLEECGELDRTSAPADRATRDRVRAYHQVLVARGYAPYTVAGRIQQLADALRVMQPDCDWKWVSRGASVMHSRARPKKSIRERIRPPEEVMQLGLDLMAAAENDRFRSPFDRAVLYRDGLIIAAMLLRPKRIKNFAAIRIGGHLRRCDEGWRVEFDRTEMKTKRDDESFAWPEVLTAPLERYLKVHREVLLDGAQNDALWVSKGGALMTTAVLGYRICKWTEEEWGKAINPHAFRHMCGTTTATENPANVTDVARLLGHATLETSEKHYTLATAVGACERYQAVVRRNRKSPGGQHRCQLSLL
jgi:integrase